jgi:hypothetical protein
MLEQFDHIETKNLGWLLLRSFVASPRLANSARCLALKGIHFDRVGFDWWVDDLLKGLFVEKRRDIAGLRREFPEFFDVLDRGGSIITSDDTLRAIVKWFIDEAHYLDDVRDLGPRRRARPWLFRSYLHRRPQSPPRRRGLPSI